MPSLSRLVNIAALTLVTGLGGLFGYRFFRAELTADVYRRRLEEAAADYSKLASSYNDAVRRTAVTELLVKNGKLSVRIRGIDSLLQEIATPFDPRGEIYIDYVVIDNRLWIRRVFDSRTAPSDGMVIDPRFIDVDWDAADAKHGKAVYRTLDEGRWIVTVTGDGSLGLAKADDRDPVAVERAPALRDYQQVVEQTTKQADAIGPSDIWRWIRGD
jgi:hypothetical protein